MNIVYVEDHTALREILCHDLQEKGFRVTGVSSGEELDEYFQHTKADLLILDINLPGESGTSIAQRYRAAHPEIYIIMLTVRSTASEKIIGYEHGADMYLPKPVSSEELHAALSSISRRLNRQQETEKHPTLDMQRMTLMYAGTEASLTGTEMLLLKSLIEANENRLDYWRLLEVIEKEINEKNKKNLGVYIHRLNRKLTDLGLHDPSIRALWKEGYQLTHKIVID